MTAYLTNCSNLTIANTVYTLQNNITNYNGTCFNITANNITLDGQGYMIDGVTKNDGTHDSGVYASAVNNVTIKNINIYQFGYPIDGAGIYFVNVNNSLIHDVNLSINVRGIRLSQSYYNKISQIIENSSEGDFGISLVSSSNNQITNVTLSENDNYGISLSSSHNNTITNLNANYNKLLQESQTSIPWMR